MKYCCGITTYYPEASDVNCVLGLTAAFSKVYIYDNTPGGIDSCLKQKLLDDPKIVFFSNGENDGLSIAYQCFHEVAKCKYDYLCLLDQDSRLTNKDISKIINSIEEDSDNSVAIYAPRIQYQHSKQLSPSNRVDIVDWVISSGSFIKIDFLNTISGFDNYYFIDRIDQDLCLCFRKKNKKIKIINSVTLLQDLGEIKNIFGLKFFQHNEFRNYHIARNRLYFYRKHKEVYTLPNIRAWLGTIKQVTHIIFIQDEKFSKVKSVISGVKDFYYANP